VLQDTGQRIGLAGLVGVRSIAITPNGNLAFVTNIASNLINILRRVNGVWTFDSTIGNLGNQPSGVAITPNGSKVYVSSFVDSKVAVLTISGSDVVADTGTRITVAAGTPNTPFGSPGLAVTPDGTRLFIASYANNLISILDTATDTLTGQTIPVGTSPTGIGMPR
jgi:YVTN family beta-propeller protein